MVSHLIETKKDGSKIVRNFFFNKDKTNYLVKSHSNFTKDEKKTVKANHKNSLKNIIEHNKKRMDLAGYIIKQDLPNWNLKFSFI